MQVDRNNVNPLLTQTTYKIDALKKLVKKTNGHNANKQNWISEILELQSKRIELKRLKKFFFGLISKL